MAALSCIYIFINVPTVRYAKIKDADNWLIIDENTADIRLNKLPDRESTFLVNGTYYAEIICISNGEFIYILAAFNISSTNGISFTNVWATFYTFLLMKTYKMAKATYYFVMQKCYFG